MKKPTESKESTGIFPWPTIGRYDYYEVVSALQKTIRRGDRDSALFWATELYLSQYEAHAWRRLLQTGVATIWQIEWFLKHRKKILEYAKRKQ